MRDDTGERERPADESVPPTEDPTTHDPPHVPPPTPPREYVPPPVEHEFVAPSAPRPIVADRDAMRRVGGAVGRGAKTFLKAFGIFLVVVLVLTLVAGAWAYHEFKPYVERNAPYPLYDYHEACSLDPCARAPVEHRFHVHDGAREVRLEVWAHGHDGKRVRDGGEYVTVNASGVVHVTVEDAAGRTVYEREFAATQSSRVRESLALAPTEGSWTVTYRYDAEYRGDVDVEVIALGLPRAALP